MRLLRVYHPIRNRRVSGPAWCGGCVAARVMDTGEKSIVARGLLITASIFLFPPSLPPPPLRRKVHGVYPRYFFHYFLPPLLLPPRTPNPMKNQYPFPPPPQENHPIIPFRKSARLYRIKSDTFSITPRFSPFSSSRISFFHLCASKRVVDSNFFDRF